MSTQTRRSSFSSSTSSSLAKRHASSSSTENAGKATAVAPHLAKKRAPLGEITNQKNATQKGSRNSIPSSTLVSTVARIVEGDAGKIICKEAERLKPAAVVMGTRG